MRMCFVSLMQIAFHSQEIPSTIGQLKLLKSLNLDKNQIRRIPGDVLQGCDLLQTLSLHSNPITAQVHTILALRMLMASSLLTQNACNTGKFGHSLL